MKRHPRRCRDLETARRQGLSLHQYRRQRRRQTRYEADLILIAGFFVLAFALLWVSDLFAGYRETAVAIFETVWPTKH